MTFPVRLLLCNAFCQSRGSIFFAFSSPVSVMGPMVCVLMHRRAFYVHIILCQTMVQGRQKFVQAASSAVKSNDK